jgi:hypothetical protein
MTSTYSYQFNNMDRIGTDVTDQTQRTLYNTRFANYTLANYTSENLSDGHVEFAMKQPTMTTNDMVLGQGINGAVVDDESILNLKKVNERHYEKLQLFESPFLTVPYLGKGSCDPTLESQLQQGEVVSDKKSVSTIMEKSFSQYALYPQDEGKTPDASKLIEESALNGWVRGGATTREMTENTDFVKQNRPTSWF